ncbi:MAG: sigma-70 family RNA polymerase sigma factor [bacterium]
MKSNKVSKPSGLPIQSDNDILEQIRRGDARKYSIIVDRHKNQAYALAFRLVGEKREAEELVQDGFVRAFRNLDQFRGDARFSTWLYRIVYNLCMTRVTRRQPRPDSIDINEEMLDNIFVDEEMGADERMETDEYNRMIAEEIQQLPEKFKSAVTLFYLQEMSYEEMTGILNLPLGTVKTNLFRGRNLLRERVLSRLKGELV